MSCFFVYYNYLLVRCSRRIWIVEHCCFYRWICRINISIYDLNSSWLFRGYIAGIAIVVMVGERQHRFLGVRTKQRENSANFQDKDSSWTSRKIPSWVPMLLCTCWCFVLNGYRLLSTVVYSVRSAVSILFYWRFCSLWFGGKITGIAIVVMAGERWQRFLVACVQAKGGCRLIRTLLLTTLSSSTTSCFGLHAYGATWNLEGKKFNLCNWTLIRETYWRKAASNFQ